MICVTCPARQVAVMNLEPQMSREQLMPMMYKVAA